MDTGRLIQTLVSAGLTVGVAESLTGGALCAELVAVPGASQVVRGGVVAYAPDVKQDLLGVDSALLAERGTVDPDVALEMAFGVRKAVRSDIGLSTTGVAGPDAVDGQPVGTVYIAVVGLGEPVVRRLELSGSRDEIRLSTIREILTLLSSLLE